MEKIRTGDEVIVLTGRDRGRRGSVLRRQGPQHLVLSGLMGVKRHTKPNPQRNQPGGILEKSMAIHISNVALFNSASQKADRVAIRRMEDGTNRRVFKSNGELIDKV